VRVNEIYETYKDGVEFFVIYIREAHPSDGWQTPQNLYDEVVYASPESDDERAEIANACQVALDIHPPLLMDGVDDSVEDQYISRPIRLFVIDREGRITYNGAPGPQGFDPDSWEAAIKDVLSEG